MHPWPAGSATKLDLESTDDVGLKSQATPTFQSKGDALDPFDLSWFDTWHIDSSSLSSFP
ncbi:unnamed protein product [Tenebrio molitor]|jgi:hypothetical protein|nr:unnamed protein product [Tenebrio molitor]